MKKPTQKLYCYIDETGQDSIGKFFIVSVVLTGEVREKLAKRLEQIEQSSGKGETKWTYSRQNSRCGFVRQALLGNDQKMIELFEQATKGGYLKEV